jgi:hypothetical protein
MRTVVASDRYSAGAVKRILAGSNWRALWAAPITVPVLDLSTFGGGLTPTKQGGNQSVTLRFKAKNGKTYIFRSMDKFVHKALSNDLEHTKAGAAIQDQSSAMHPTGGVIVARLEEKAGLLQVRPQIVIMPDDPRLGEFRKQFGNLIGMIEERPDEAEEGQKLFGGADKIVSTPKFVQDLEETLAHRLDSREYLRARLIDFMVGDTDRGADQWRWARFDRGDQHLFRPIPRDHDYGFMRPNGLGAALVKTTFQKLVVFGDNFPSITALTFMTRDFDRAHLSDLPRVAWDSVVTSVQNRLTDQVIAEAVNLLPPPHRAISGERIASGLRERRTKLPEIARDFYNLVNGEADVFGTEEEELAIIDREADGSVLVSLFRKQGPSATDDGDTGGSAAWQRRFQADETKEVRIYLQGGNDRAVVRGTSTAGIKVRITGGAGDDVLVDSATVGSGSTVFYDAFGKNQFITTSKTRVDTRTYITVQPLDDDEQKPEEKTLTQLLGEERRGRFQDEVLANSKDFFAAKTQSAFLRTFGSNFSVRPMVDYRLGAGIILGGGPVYQQFGFRHVPRELSATITPMISTSTGGLGIQGLMELYPENARHSYTLLGRGTTFEAIRFNGFGNDSEQLVDDASLIYRDEILVLPAVNFLLWRMGTVSAGPVLRYSNPRPDVGSPAWQTRTSAGLGQVGAHADVRLAYDASKDVVVSKGARLFASAAAYPALWDVESAYGSLQVEGAVYMPLFRPSLALRAGAKRVWGDDFPLQDAAFVGGRTTLRGFQWGRFAGDTEAHGSAELRVPITRTELLIRGDLGVFALADVGRVWFEGESPDGWHFGKGGGVWFSTLGHVVSLMYAHGEEGRFYIQFGLPY